MFGIAYLSRNRLLQRCQCPCYAPHAVLVTQATQYNYVCHSIAVRLGAIHNLAIGRVRMLCEAICVDKASRDMTQPMRGKDRDER